MKSLDEESVYFVLGLLLRLLLVCKTIAAYLVMLASEQLLNFSFPLVVHQSMAAVNIDSVKVVIDTVTVATRYNLQICKGALICFLPLRCCTHTDSERSSF